MDKEAILCITVVAVLTSFALSLLLVNFSKSSQVQVECKGEIIDFEISAGGYAHSDVCKIKTNETILTCSGKVCRYLEIGKLLYIVKREYEQSCVLKPWR